MSKKLLGMFLVLVLLSVSLVGCVGSKYNDGTYTATFEKMGEQGWRPEVILTIKDDQITEVSYEEYNKDGDKKSLDSEYHEKYADITEIELDFPASYKELGDQVIASQDPVVIDGVSGVTHSSDDFKELVKAILEHAEDGEPGTITIK